MATPAIRFIVAAKGPKAKEGLVQLQLLCHVKPGVNAIREGIGAVNDDHIQVCVAAQARDGEANKAVREVIAKSLKVPKSDVEISKGMKSREKTVVISNIRRIETRSPKEEVDHVKTLLQNAVAL